MNQEKTHVIQTMTKKTLNKDKDCVCHKCERKAGSQLEKSDHQPTKKKRVSDELCFLNKTNMCTGVASRNSNLLNIPIFCDFFGIKKENFDPNQSSVALCTKHYHKYYHHINSCKICLSHLQHAAKCKVSPENIELAISYYKTIYPDKNLILTTNDGICSNCYFLIRNLGKSSQSVDPNSDLNSIIKKYTESSYENKMDLAVKKSVIFVAKKFLNNEAVLFPEVLDLYMSPSASDPDDDNSGTNNLDDSDIDNLSNSVSDKLDESVSINEAAFPKRSRWLLMSALSSALFGHIDFHRLTGRKLGIMFYRKGSDILVSLHHLLHQERLKRKSLCEGGYNVGLTLSEEALLFEAAMILNNIVIGQAKSSPKPLNDEVDISEISLTNLINDTDSKWWNFIFLMTMNQTKRKQFEKECGIDWSSHVCDSKNQVL